MIGWDWDEFLIAGGVAVGALAALALGYLMWTWRATMRREAQSEDSRASG
jgi:hypothetical protein